MMKLLACLMVRQVANVQFNAAKTMGKLIPHVDGAWSNRQLSLSLQAASAGSEKFGVCAPRACGFNIESSRI